MKFASLFVCLFLMLAIAGAAQPASKGWQIIEQKAKKQIDILFGGKLLTSYCYYDSVRKPILFPINTLSGITVTRGFPVATRAGDHVDHPHHTGLWMNYESVNGLDFWNNSPAIPVKDRNRYGTIFHQKLISTKVEKEFAMLTVHAQWKKPDGNALLEEETTFRFETRGNEFIIDRITTLKANDEEVVFKDVKDGFLGMRVASELEQPSAGNLEFVDVHGKVTKVDATTAQQATGMYVSSTGLKGDAVWGTRGRWCTLNGTKEGHQISITMIDHPANVGYPTYWHARGYGLFAANPLGQEIFSNGKEKLNFTLTPDAVTTFMYRIVVASETRLTPDHINMLADEFAKTQN